MSDDWASILLVEGEGLGTLRVHNTKFLSLLVTTPWEVLLFFKKGRHSWSQSEGLWMENQRGIFALDLSGRSLIIDIVGWCGWLWGVIFVSQICVWSGGRSPSSWILWKKIILTLGFAPWILILSRTGEHFFLTRRLWVSPSSHHVFSTLWANNLLCFLRSVLTSLHLSCCTL